MKPSILLSWCIGYDVAKEYYPARRFPDGPPFSQPLNTVL
jgi:hypothetical protein